MTTVEQVQSQLLCDACGARATVIAAKGDDLGLFFCSHHGRKHAAALKDAGWEVVSE